MQLEHLQDIVIKKIGKLLRCDILNYIPAYKVIIQCVYLIIVNRLNRKLLLVIDRRMNIILVCVFQ